MTSNTDLYAEGLQSLRGNWLHALAACLLIFLLQGVASGLYVGVIFLGALNIGLYAYFSHLTTMRHRPPIEMIFEGFNSGHRFVQSIIAVLLTGILVSVGMMFLIIPGVIAAIGLSMTFFFMAESPQMRATDAIRASWDLVWTQGNFWKVLGFHLLAMPLFLAGILLLVVGLFVAMPIYFAGLARLFVALKGQTQLP